MAYFSGGRPPAGVWTRRVALCCFGVVSTTLVVGVLLAAVLIVSGVIEW